jgi:hypothetical protein
MVLWLDSAVLSIQALSFIRVPSGFTFCFLKKIRISASLISKKKFLWPLSSNTVSIYKL